MKYGIMFEQGEILIVPFPFSNLEGIKQRPVLVISNSKYNKNSEDIITCGITSNLKDSDCSVLIDNENLLKGKIPIASKIKVDKLFTLNKSIIIKKIARINDDSLKKVKKEFINLI
jgi:mRNA interferase MazF